VRNAARLTAFGGVLVLVFALAWTVGARFGDVPYGAPGHSHPGEESTAGQEHQIVAAQEEPGGLSVTEAGYSLTPRTTTFSPGTPGEFAFTVTDPDGRLVTGFDTAHDERLDLIVVRRDAACFQRLHPELGADGVWRTLLTLPTGGVYRAFAAFTPTRGEPLTLGTDLFAPGHFVPTEQAPSRLAEVDGYQVTIDGTLISGTPTRLVASVSRGGVPITDLQPYLGAFGHLVALREHDLGYLHVHPDAVTPPGPSDRAGPRIAFTAEVPTPGTYRLFFGFRHAGAVRTVAFTMITTAPDAPR